MERAAGRCKPPGVAPLRRKKEDSPMRRLPRETKETGYAVCRELEQAEDNDYIIQLLERLEEDNPCIAEFVSRLAIQHEDPVGIATSALLVYRLLESQLDANELRKKIKID